MKQRGLRLGKGTHHSRLWFATGANAKHRDLRTALQSLSDASLKTSRRLDDTYYSILEKVSTLRQTIGSLQELSGLTKELHHNFDADSQDLLEDVQGQFENSDNFDAQQKQVTVLEERIRKGKEKADRLTERLAEAKERVDRRAKSEAQWEASTNRKFAGTPSYRAYANTHRLVAILWRHNGLHRHSDPHTSRSPPS